MFVVVMLSAVTGVNVTVQFAGAPLNVGWNGPFVGARLNNPVTFDDGLFAMSYATCCTFVGVVPATAANRLAHGCPEAVLPVEFTHVARRFASVSSFACGTTCVPSGVTRRGYPVFGFTRLLAAVNAVLRFDALAGVEPTLPVNEIKPPKPYTLATVVASFSTQWLPLTRLLHGPTAVTSWIAVLLVPVANPGLPPVAVRYTSWFGDDVQLNAPPSENDPLPFVVTLVG
jgi:hypothetical protein